MVAATINFGLDNPTTAVQRSPLGNPKAKTRRPFLERRVFYLNIVIEVFLSFAGLAATYSSTS